MFITIEMLSTLGNWLFTANIQDQSDHAYFKDMQDFFQLVLLSFLQYSRCSKNFEHFFSFCSQIKYWFSGLKFTKCSSE